MTRRAIWSASMVVFITAGAANASAPLKPAGESTVKFTATGVAGMKINGTTARLTLDDAGDTMTFKTPTNEFKTGIGLRDRHLKEHVEADKFPEATLEVERSKVALDGSGGTQKTVVASFTFHGVKRPVQVRYTAEKAGGKYRVKGSFDVSLPDFKIKKPCYLGVCVDEKVTVEAEFGVKE